MNSVYDKKWSIYQVVMIIVCCLAIVITLIPILNIVATSFSGKNAIAKGIVGIFPVEFTTEAYEMVFKNSGIVRSLFYSIFLTVGYALLATFMTILAAYPLSKTDLKGRHVFQTIITVTMYVSAGTVPAYLLIKNLGLMNTVWALVIPGMISPFNLIILRTFFAGINKALYEAAYMDGCGEWGCLFRITIPLSLPSIFTIMLFYAISRWNGVTDVLYYVNKPDLYTLQYQLKLMLDSLTIPYKPEEMATMQITPENVKSSTIVFAMVPMLLIYPFVQKYFTKGVTIGGVKE
ncbi:carbohydrate ABC transporter permease [Lachnotalea sp. AF33-28]|uniref:carbohydrate ABC transporter permease n=1 Tax=Lachnotalea sp. AF33-28 TaxID=2292046 RepID=UPI000E543E52|nr:carbohydrate ABC transporter permease [Lachnotalea sp. AF33-28]RHP32300.1 carbohydrate ABC transporter permease [Lachnotalea sp. AF33-28]